jgi:hypothetical protein
MKLFIWPQLKTGISDPVISGNPFSWLMAGIFYLAATYQEGEKPAGAGKTG